MMMNMMILTVMIRGYLMPNWFLYIETVLFQTIQFSICTQVSSIWLIDRILSGDPVPGQNGPGSNSHEEVLHISHSSSITGTSPSDCLLSYPGYSFGRVLPLCREAVGVFWSLSRQNNADGGGDNDNNNKNDNNYNNNNQVMLTTQISLNLSLPISPYHSSPPAVLPDYIMGPHRADVNKFLWLADTGMSMCRGL